MLFYYARRKCDADPGRKPGKRGPKTQISDEQRAKQIRELLEASPFLGEGYREVRAKLRVDGVRVGKERVRRVMREAGLQAPYHALRNLGPPVHDGTITTDQPGRMWGTDLTSTATIEQGRKKNRLLGRIDHERASLLFGICR